MVFDYLGGGVVPNLDKEKENEGGLRKGEKGRFPQKQAQDVLTGIEIERYRQYSGNQQKGQQ